MNNERNHQNNRPRAKGQQQQRLTSSDNHKRESIPHLHNPAMADGLQALMKQSFAEAPPEQLAPHAHVRLGQIPSSSNDGVTYINFSSAARTELGHLLSFDNMLAFEHPLLGIKVPTIQHYWAFIQSGVENHKIFSFTNEKLRGFQRQLGRPVHVRNQYGLLAAAYWAKFQAYPTLIDVFVQYKEDFDYFLDRENNRRRPMSAPYLVDIMRQIRVALRTGRPLDLARFMDQDVQLEVKTMTPAARTERVLQILSDQHKTARARIEQSRANKEANRQKQQARAQEPEAAASVTTNDLISVASTGFKPRLTPEELAENNATSVAAASPQASAVEQSGPDDDATMSHLRAQAEAMPIDMVEAVDVLDSEDVVAVAAPTAPASPSAPAAPASPAAPAAPASPAAPAAPSASAEDGDVLVLNGFVVPAAQLAV